MKKLFLLSFILSSLLAQQYDHPNSVVVENTELRVGHQYLELNVWLTNGDIVTYTFIERLQADACIYAAKQEGHFETRENVSGTWLHHMRGLFEKKVGEINSTVKINYSHFLKGIKK